jgi:hypothetical protein
VRMTKFTSSSGTSEIWMDFLWDDGFVFVGEKADSLLYPAVSISSFKLKIIIYVYDHWKSMAS